MLAREIGVDDPVRYRKFWFIHWQLCLFVKNGPYVTVLTHFETAGISGLEDANLRGLCFQKRALIRNGAGVPATPNRRDSAIPVKQRYACLLTHIAYIRSSTRIREHCRVAILMLLRHRVGKAPLESDQRGPVEMNLSSNAFAPHPPSVVDY